MPVDNIFARTPGCIYFPLFMDGAMLGQDRDHVTSPAETSFIGI